MDNGVRVETPQALVENVLQLISLPEIYLRLQQTIDDPEHSREQVAEIVAYDPALSARVLRIANSSYYGFAREIETVSSAVGIIGELDLRNLVLATTVVGSMSALKYSGVNIDEFWLHSLRCGITARQIAKTIDGAESEILFLAGMLHDIGILVIYQQDVILANAVKRQIEEQHQLRDQAEREVMGFDHAEVGALLIEAWGLSVTLRELTRCHHQYQLAASDHKATMILALANLLTSSDLAQAGEYDTRHEILIGKLELDENNLDEIVETSEQQCAEVKSIILG